MWVCIRWQPGDTVIKPKVEQTLKVECHSLSGDNNWKITLPETHKVQRKSVVHWEKEKAMKGVGLERDKKEERVKSRRK